MFYLARNEKGKNPVLPTEKELEVLFKGLSRFFSSVIVTIDGLDECSIPEERKRLLTFLSSLSSPEIGNFKTIYTSRNEIDIREQPSPCTGSISIAAGGHDLELFVAAGIASRISDKQLRLRDPTLKDNIITKIVEKVQGMYDLKSVFTNS